MVRPPTPAKNFSIFPPFAFACRLLIQNNGLFFKTTAISLIQAVFRQRPHFFTCENSNYKPAVYSTKRDLDATCCFINIFSLFPVAFSLLRA
jgi:hypothetical protein